MGRRKRSGAAATGKALYWLSGAALIGEPVRYAARSGQRQQERVAAAARQAEMLRRADWVAAEQARAAYQAEVARQQAWAEHHRAVAEWQRQQRGRPVTCGYCRRESPAGSVRCEHCGAPRETV